MTAEELITRLRNIGYILNLEKEGIRFRYGREGDPPEETAILLSEVKIHKQEIIEFMKEEPFRLIKQALIEIDRHWECGALEWIKRAQPSEFKKMINLEEEINRFALNGDTKGLNNLLKSYKDLMAEMARVFIAQKREEGIF